MSNHGPHHDYTVSGDAMRWTDQPPTDSRADLYGEPIHTYSRADAIATGYLVDVTDTAREAGFTVPVALTRAVWADCVAWTADDARRKPHVIQDEAGRLWDVLYMAGLTIRRMPSGFDTTRYQIVRVPRPGHGRRRNVVLTVRVGPGDAGESVATISQPGED